MVGKLESRDHFQIIKKEIDAKYLFIQKLCTYEYDQFKQNVSKQFSIQEQKLIKDIFFISP